VLVSAVSVGAAPRRSSQSSIILNAPGGSSTFAAESWEPSLGEAVNFTTSFPDGLASYLVYVQVVCYQNGAPVFAGSVPYNRSITLGGLVSPWLSSGGAATCKADLYYWSNTG